MKLFRKPNSRFYWYDFVEQFHSFSENLAEPFRTLPLLCVCLGLRVSETLALRWGDVDWLNARLSVEGGIVCQEVTS